MLRHLTLLLSLLSVNTACSEAPAPPTKGLVIEGGDLDRPYFHDFGVILDGTSPSHVYRFRNTESNPVTLKDVLASCSCAVPTVRVVSRSGAVTPGRLRNDGAVCVIPPGDALEVEVEMDTSRIRRKNTDRLSTVRLRTSSAVTPFHTLEMHVKVQQLIQATPWEIELGEIPRNEIGRGETVVIVAVQDADVELRTARSLSPELEVTSTEEERFGQRVWVVEAQLEPGLPMGPWAGALQLIVDAAAFDPPERKVRVPVRANVVEDIVLRPRRVFLMRSNERGAEFTAEALIPGARFTISSAELRDCPDRLYTTEVTPIAPDARGQAAKWKIRVKPTEVSQEGEVNARLVVTLDTGEVLESALLGR
ncbi:MAG: DUF1573 domain-containing protein [Planctomycetes bacterium]|nr:DUF1573 domain-containing protein [Planctomycetota bacterium]